MKNYYRVMLGRASVFAQECFEGGFIGADFGFDFDLAGRLSDNWKDFNREFIPVFLNKFPEKTKVGAGLACGALHTVAKGVSIGDIILSPTGSGSYYVGEVTGDYGDK